MKARITEPYDYEDLKIVCHGQNQFHVVAVHTEYRFQAILIILDSRESAQGYINSVNFNKKIYLKKGDE